MKKIKIILTVILSIAIISACLAVYAEPPFVASFSLLQSQKSDYSEIIYVIPNEEISVDLKLTTSKDYFAGPLSTSIFYTSSFFTNPDLTLNTNGKLYSCCKTYTNAAFSTALTSKAVNAAYPTAWTDAEKQKYKFCNLIMLPNATDCSATPDELSETLITLTFNAGSVVGSSGEIFIPKESERTKNNLTGGTFLSCYTDNGSLSGERYDYGRDMSLDFSNASIKYVVTNMADIDGNEKINSVDALLALQKSVGIVDLTKEQIERADIDKNGIINSSDALIILQLATGLTKINDYMTDVR